MSRCSTIRIEFEPANGRKFPKQVVLRQFALQGLLRGSLPVAVSDAADRAETRTLGDDGTKTALSSPRREEG